MTGTATAAALAQPAGNIPTVMRAAVLRETRRIELEERPVPEPRADEVLVRVAAVGVCGSDTHYYREGRIGEFVLTAPLILGHEASGTIVAVGDDVPASRIGERVSIEPQRPCRVCEQCSAGHYNLCPSMEFFATPPIDGAFCEYVTIQSSFAHTVPDAISDDAAALFEPLSVGIASLQKANIGPGSTVLIAGAGPIGTICAQVAAAFGASEIIVSDPDEKRRALIAAGPATRVIDPLTESVADLGVDAFLDCSGATPAVRSGLTAVRGGGAVVLVGMGQDEIALSIPTIQNRELTVTGIFRYANTWPLARHLVASGQVDLDSLVTGHFGLEQTTEALESDRTPGSLKSVVHPGR